MARLRFLMATKRRALYGVLLLCALPAVATAGSGVRIGISTGVSTVANKKVASMTQLTVSPSSAEQGQTVTFTATVTFGVAYAPAGTRVAFRVDGTKVATPATTAGGVATFSTSVATFPGTIAGGTHVIRAAYTGSATVKRSRASKRLFVRCPGASGACESLLADPKPAVRTAVYAGQTLTIVAMNEKPLGTSGEFAPSAVLSTGESLVVTTKATARKPANYVDSNGDSEGSRYQLLLSFPLPGDLAPGSYAILVTAYDNDGDSDQWFWPITVSASPPAVPYTIGGRITTPLYPGGAPSPIKLRFSNPNVGSGGSGAIGVQISNLTVTISAVSGPSATPELPCTISDFAVTQFSGTYPFVIPQGRSNLRTLGFVQGTWPAVRLVDRPVNQNGCRGATLTIAYSGAS